MAEHKLTAAVLRRHRDLWRKAYFRLVPLALFAFLGGYIAASSRSFHVVGISYQFFAFVGVIIFASSTITALHVLTSTTRKVMTHYLGPARASNAQFVMLVTGYAVIVLGVLGILHIPVGKLLLGGAVTGIILGVAAQQSLANFFASVILLITQPYSVGERVFIKSGGLGEYRGIVLDIGLIHTRLRLEDDTIVLLPNSAILTGSAITPLPPVAQVPEHTAAG